MNNDILKKGNDFDVIKPTRFRQHKQLIKDLFDPTDKVRNEGRSTILAEVFLDLAKENPNTKIKLVDHHPNSRAVEFLASSIVAPMIRQRNAELAKENYRSFYRLMDDRKDYYVIYSTTGIDITNERIK